MQEEEKTSALADIQDESSGSISEKISLPREFQITKKSLITIVICTGLSILFMNTGLLAFFYLVPLGYAIIITGSFTVTFIISAAATIIFSFISGNNNPSTSGTLMQLLFILTFILSYTWIIGGKKTRTLYRFIAASTVSTIVLLLLINHPSLRIFEQVNELINIIFGAETEQGNLNSFPSVAPDRMVDLASNFLLRGGAVISMFILFFINRQLAFTVIMIVKKQRIDRGLIAFFAPVNTVWVLTGALITVLLTRMLNIEILEILAWNVLVICGIIFSAQGAGVLMHWMLSRTNVFRLILSVLIVVLMFSPINVFLLAALLILGIVDNWMSFRTQKSLKEQNVQ